MSKLAQATRRASVLAGVGWFALLVNLVGCGVEDAGAYPLLAYNDTERQAVVKITGPQSGIEAPLVVSLPPHSGGVVLVGRNVDWKVELLDSTCAPVSHTGLGLHSIQLVVVSDSPPPLGVYGSVYDRASLPGIEANTIPPSSICS